MLVVWVVVRASRGGTFVQLLQSLECHTSSIGTVDRMEVSCSDCIVAEYFTHPVLGLPWEWRFEDILTREQNTLQFTLGDNNT